MIKEIVNDGGIDNLYLKNGGFAGAEFSSFLADEAIVKLYGDLNGEYIVRKNFEFEGAETIYYFEIIGNGVSAKLPISASQYRKPDKRSVYRAVVKTIVN